MPEKKVRDRMLTPVKCSPMNDNECDIIPFQGSRILIIQHSAIHVYGGHRHLRI